MIAPSKNTSAPTGVVDPTGAAPRVATNASGRGDGEPHRPLPATYTSTPTTDKHRRVTWVTVRTGQVHSFLLETGREPQRTSGSLLTDLRLLVHDPHADPQTNSALAMLAMAAIRECDEALRVPRVLADGLFEELGRQAHRIQTLETTLTTLRADLARATSRSAS